MLFNSFDFIIFVLLVLPTYFLLGRARHGVRAQNAFLLVASYYFYGYWDYRFLSLLLLSSVLDYCAALLIDHAPTPKRRKALLAVSMSANLGILGIFKYLGFFVDSAARMLTSLGFDPHLPTLHIILPVGISFYTFQTMSYTIDVYRGEMKPTRSFLDFALFVSFFPQLVAGPIERAKALLPQIQAPRHYDPAQFRDGLHLIVWGMYKKVFVADMLSRFVVEDMFTGQLGGMSGLDVLLGLYAFALQIYCDFSGYTDIARGICKLMGFELMLNFNLPYFATDPSDFWRRWHISLSSWLREYLYIPLGGNRHGTFNTYRNLALTMLLGGLWHGAAWHFVAWGAFHGLILMIWHAISQAAPRLSRPTGLTRVVMILVMFHFTCVGWLLFRANHMGQVSDMLWLMVTDWQVSAHTASIFQNILGYGWLLIAVQFVQYFRGELHFMRGYHWLLQITYYELLVLGLIETFGRPGREFIYFQF